ncbi:MAG: tetratricopeptide repeat protein [Bacteroidota bacterium]
MKPTILCAECQAEIQWGDRYCNDCGKPVEWPARPALSGWPNEETAAEAESTVSEEQLTCKQCGTENPAEAEFCASCGVNLRVTKEAAPRKGGSQESRRQADKEKTRRAGKKTESAVPLVSWKMIAGFVAFLVVGIVLLDALTGPRELPKSQVQPMQVQGANIQAAAQIGELEKRVGANPNDMQLTLELANLSYDNRFFDKAIQYYKRFLEKNPKDANVRVDLGTSYYESGNFDEARRQMETALKYDPKHLQAHFNLGIVNLGAGRLKEANDWFKKTIALAPDSEVGQRARQFLEQHSNPQILPNQ